MPYVLRILCNLCISLGQVSVGTIYQHVNQVSADSQSPYRLTVGQHSTNMSAGSTDTPIHHQYTGQHSVDTGSVNCRWNIGQLSMEYGSTIGGISVDCCII